MTDINNNFVWRGRDDQEDGELGLRWHHKINQGANKAATANIALVGFPSDLGVQANKGRLGAKKGPNAIRSALANYAYHAKASICDIGDIAIGYDLAIAQQKYADVITKQLSQKTLVIGLGGGHEIAWGSYLGLRQHSTQKRIGIVNIDAHFDLRKPAPQPSSGTPFRQIAEHCQQQQQAFHYCCLGVAEPANTPALFHYADELGVSYLMDDQCNLDNAKELLTPFLHNIDELYLTLCLDALPASIAPGVSAPSALGVALNEIIPLIHWLAQQQSILHYQWRLADIAEMNPDFDLDNRTAKVAARLIYEMVKAKFTFVD